MADQSALESFVELLDGVPASEFLLLADPAVLPVLSALAPYSLLTSHGVTALMPLTTEVAETTHDSHAIVYLTHSEPDSVALVGKSAQANQGSTLCVIVTREVEASVVVILTKFGVLGDVDLKAWPVGLVPDPIEPTILQTFSSASVHDTKKAVWPLVWALDHLQKVDSGAFGRVTAIGATSKYIAHLLRAKRDESRVKDQTIKLGDGLDLDETQLTTHQNRREFVDYRIGYASSTFFGASFEHVIIIDRDLDLLTPLLCQTTYQGVLAESIGFTSSGTTQRGTKASLKADPLFRSIAQNGFAEACEYLHISAKEIQEAYHRGSDISRQDSSLAEIRTVVQNLGSLQATQRLVDTHTDLATLIMKEMETGVRRDAFELQGQLLDHQLTTTQVVARIQDLMYRGAPLTLVLRLLALLCQLRGGLKESMLHQLFYGDVLRTYGYQALNILPYVRERGLIFPSKASSFQSLLSPSQLTSFTRFGSDTTPGGSSAADSSKLGGGISAAGNGFTMDGDMSTLAERPEGPLYPWSSLMRPYKLYPSQAPESKQYAGYVPLTARLAQMARGIVPVAKTAMEVEFEDETFTTRDELAHREAKIRRTLSRNTRKASTSPRVLVVVPGGVTYAEATAIQQALRQPGKDEREIVVASSCIITGDDIVTNLTK